MCSCGLGKFPNGYNVHDAQREAVLKSCIRAAIAPYFPGPFMIEALDVGDLEETGFQGLTSGILG